MLPGLTVLDFMQVFLYFPDTTGKVLSFCLPEIKVFMTLVVTVQDAGLARQSIWLTKGRSSALPSVKNIFDGIDWLISKPRWYFGFLAVTSIIGPVHRKNRINQ